MIVPQINLGVYWYISEHPIVHDRPPNINLRQVAVEIWSPPEYSVWRICELQVSTGSASRIIKQHTNIKTYETACVSVCMWAQICPSGLRDQSHAIERDEKQVQNGRKQSILWELQRCGSVIFRCFLCTSVSTSLGWLHGQNKSIGWGGWKWSTVFKSNEVCDFARLYSVF